MSGEKRGARPVRVLHVVEAFGGGVFEVVRALAEYLAEEGHPVAIAYGRRSETPVDVRSCISPAVELCALPWEHRGPREQLAAARGLRRFAAEWDHDVVHLHSSFAGIVGSLALGRAKPTVYTPHGYSFTMRSQNRPRRVAYKTIERITARRVDLVGAVSTAEARDAQQVAPERKIVVVRNGIPELDQRRTGPAPDRGSGPPRVMALGRITAQRRPASAARILAALSDVAEVSWVGGGGRGGMPDSTVTDLGVPVTGWVDRAEVLSTLASATVYLHWTAWDGQPLSILEAMAKDVVVVASDIEAAREILGPRQVCSSEAEATALIRDVLRDPGLREDLLASQRERSDQFGARRMVHEWRTVYGRLARVPAPPLRTAPESAPTRPKTMSPTDTIPR